MRLQANWLRKKEQGLPARSQTPIQNSAVPYLWVEGEDETRNIKILSNMMVDLQAVVDIDPKEVGVTEQVYYPVLAALLRRRQATSKR